MWKRAETSPPAGTSASSSLLDTSRTDGAGRLDEDDELVVWSGVSSAHTTGVDDIARSLFDDAGVGYWELDLATGQIDRNESHDRIFGYDTLQPAWSLDALREHVLPEDRALLDGWFERVAKEGQVQLVVRIRRADGTVGRVRITARVSSATGERPSRIAGVVLGDTDSQQTDPGPREREREFAIMVDNIPQLAWMADEQGSIFWYNRRWYEYTGTSLEEVQGWGWRCAHHPDHVGRVVEGITHAFETGEPWEDLFPLRRADGEYRWFLSRAQPIRNDLGDVIRWFGTNTDVTDRFELESALRESEDRFKRLASAMPQLVWTALPDGTLDYLNQRMSEYAGFAYGEGAWSWEGVIHPDDAEGTGRVWRAALTSGEVYEVEHRALMADGTYRWHLTRGLPMRDASDRVVRWYGTSTDIHDLKEAQQALERAHDRFSVALEAAEMGTWETDFVRGTSHRSLRHDQIFGYDKLQPEWNIAVARRHVLAEDLAAFDRAAEAAQASGKLRHEVRIRRPDGKVRWILSLGKLYRDDDGHPVRRAGVIMDVTERKEAEEALRQINEVLEEQVATRTRQLEAARDHFATLFEAAPVAAAILSVRSGQLLEANPELGHFFGRETRELTGRSIRELGLFGERSPHGDLVRRILRRMSIRNEEIVLQLPGAVERTALVSIEPLEIGADPCVLVMLVDITERKRAEEDVRRLSSSLALAEQRERRRLSQVLHDDLQQILFGAEMRAAAAQQNVELLGEHVAEQIDRMRDLLASAIQTTRALAIELNPPVLRGEGLEPALLWLARHMQQMHGLDVDVDLQGALSLPGEDERVLVVQMARELLFNVVKHAGVRQARLTASATEAKLVLCVSDDGTGFDYDELIRSNEHRDSLGLFSVAERLRLIGGRLKVESAIGRGTSVFIEVPVRSS